MTDELFRRCPTRSKSRLDRMGLLPADASSLSLCMKFRCAVAGCAFRSDRSNNFKRHTMTHTGASVLLRSYSPRPSQLTWAQVGLSRKDACPLFSLPLCRSGEKPFVCGQPGCTYATADSGALVRHVRVHSGAKPALCNWEGCDYCATDHSNLARHYITHLRVRPFTCPDPGCTYAAAQNSSLNSHTRRGSHTRSRDYPCQAAGCDYTACHSRDLRAHSKRCRWPGAAIPLMSRRPKSHVPLGKRPKLTRPALTRFPNR